MRIFPQILQPTYLAIAKNISLTLLAFFAEVSRKSKPFSSAYAFASSYSTVRRDPRSLLLPARRKNSLLENLLIFYLWWNNKSNQNLIKITSLKNSHRKRKLSKYHPDNFFQLSLKSRAIKAVMQASNWVCFTAFIMLNFMVILNDGGKSCCPWIWDHI